MYVDEVVLVDGVTFFLFFLGRISLSILGLETRKLTAEVRLLPVPDVYRSLSRSVIDIHETRREIILIHEPSSSSFLMLPLNKKHTEHQERDGQRYQTQENSTPQTLIPQQFLPEVRPRGNDTTLETSS